VHTTKLFITKHEVRAQHKSFSQWCCGAHPSPLRTYSGIASLAPRQPAAGGVLFVRHVVELYPFMLNPMRSIGIIFIGNKSFSDFSSNLCIAQIFAKNSTDKPIEKLLILMSIKSSYVPFAFGHLEKK